MGRVDVVAEGSSVREETAPRNAGATLLRVAWLAVALGLAMEGRGVSAAVRLVSGLFAAVPRVSENPFAEALSEGARELAREMDVTNPAWEHRMARAQPLGARSHHARRTRRN